jgi:hypothetical protein
MTQVTNSEYNYSKKDLIPILLDQKSTMNRIIDQGDKYAGVIETIQNAIDSANDPYKDHNEIDIYFNPHASNDDPFLIIRDKGASLLKQYNSIDDFIHAKKSISNKGDLEIGINGQGMAQMHATSLVQQIITMTGNNLDTDHIFEFEMVPSRETDTESRISYTRPEQYSVTINNMSKLRIYDRGTIVKFLYPHPEAEPINPKIAIDRVREIFGWRMVQCPNMKISYAIEGKNKRDNNGYLVYKTIEVPSYLKGKTAKDVDHLIARVGTRTIHRDGIPKKINPEVRGFLVKEQSGKGDIVIHVMGYRVCTVPSGELKKGTLYVNCNELKYILTPTRKDFTDRETIEELINHCRREFRDCEDIVTDKFNQRKEKSILQRINKMMSPLMTKWLKELKTRIGEDKDPIDGLPIKSLGNHRQTNCGNGGDVHVPIDLVPKLPPIGDPPEDPDDPNITKVRRTNWDENKNRGVFEHVEINNTSDSDDLLSFDRTTNTLIIYSKNKAYDFCMVPSLQDDRCVPHFARMFLKLQNENLSKEEYEKKLFSLHNQIAGGI